MSRTVSCNGANISRSRSTRRAAFVYLPPGCEGSTDRYPVLYVLHGAGGDENVWLDRMQANVILDNLIADSGLDPLVVVVPHGFTNRMATDERPRVHTFRSTPGAHTPAVWSRYLHEVAPQLF